MRSLSVTHLCDFAALRGHEDTHKKCWDVEVTAVRVNNVWENGDETENHDRKKKDDDGARRTRRTWTRVKARRWVGGRWQREGRLQTSGTVRVSPQLPKMRSIRIYHFLLPMSNHTAASQWHYAFLWHEPNLQKYNHEVQPAIPEGQ